MIIKTTQDTVRVKAERATYLYVEIEEGQAGHTEECLHLYFPGYARLVKSEEGHFVLILRRIP